MTPSLENPLFNSAEPGQGRLLTRRDLLAIVFKRKFVIASLWIGVSVLVAAALLYLPPSYVAEAKLLIKIEQQGRPSFFSGIAAYSETLDNEPSSRKLETEMEVILSRPLAEQVVQELKLQPKDMYHPPYVHLLEPLARIIGWLKTSMIGLPPPPSRAFDETVESLVKSLNVDLAKSKSGETTPNLIVIKFKASTAAVAREALAILLLRYQHFSNELDQRNGERAYHIIEQRSAKAASLVAQAQDKLKRFVARGLQAPSVVHEETVLPVTRNAHVGQSEDGADLGRALIANAARPAVAAPGNDSATSVLRSRLTQLELELVEQQQLYTNKVENLSSLKAVISEVRGKLAAQAAQAAEDSDKLTTLRRDLRMAEDHYFDFKLKLTQIGLFLEMNPDRVSSRFLLEPPLLPESSEWKKSLLIAIASSIAGLLLGLGVASFLEYSDHRLGAPRDVERFTGLPVLMTIDWMDADMMQTFTGTEGYHKR